MSFESQSGEMGMRTSPGGFEFGVQGWIWGEPIPKSITFFLDGSAMVCDQYGRQIRRAVTNDGRELRFADSPPEGDRDGWITPRPQFATHLQVIQALAEERIDWLAYDVKFITATGSKKVRTGLTLKEAGSVQAQMLQQGSKMAIIERSIACAGWPQLPYDMLKKIPELPPTPMEELRKIQDPQLRKDALRIKREFEDVRKRELQALEQEETDATQKATK